MEYDLKQDKLLLGMLRLKDIDQPWFYCDFEPTEAFQTVQPLFTKELEFLNNNQMEEWEEAYQKIDDLKLSLCGKAEENVITEFLLHIEEEVAWFRY